MVYNKRVRSLRGRIKGVEGWEGGELEGRIKRWRRGGYRKRCVKNHNAPVPVPMRSIMMSE